MLNQNPEQLALNNNEHKFDVDTNRANGFDLEVLEQFMGDFSVLKEHLVIEKIDHYQNLLKKWMPFSEKLIVYNKIETPDYNLFSILKIPQLKYKEDEVHTPFLTNLLNVRGSHHQGSLFYELFLKVCISDESLRQQFLLNDYSKLFIEEEKSTSNGRIDILITCHDFDKSFAICIENKINAPDQDKQLERYHEILDSKYKNFIMFYLTPNGAFPSGRSISDEKLTNLIYRGQLKIISYNYHIKTILTDAAKSISSNKLAGTLQQYLAII